MGASSQLDYLRRPVAARKQRVHPLQKRYLHHRGVCHKPGQIAIVLQVRALQVCFCCLNATAYPQVAESHKVTAAVARHQQISSKILAGLQGARAQASSHALQLAFVHTGQSYVSLSTFGGADKLAPHSFARVVAALIRCDSLSISA